MIQLKTLLTCIDNSGASIVECVMVIGKRGAAMIGDRITVVVQESRGSSTIGLSATNKVNRGDMRQAVVVRAKYPTKRRDGSVLKFDDNACVLINKTGDPVGTRIVGVVASDLRKRGWLKILSMAPMQI